MNYKRTKIAYEWTWVLSSNYRTDCNSCIICILHKENSGKKCVIVMLHGGEEKMKTIVHWQIIPKRPLWCLFLLEERSLLTANLLFLIMYTCMPSTSYSIWYKKMSFDAGKFIRVLGKRFVNNRETVEMIQKGGYF